MRDDQLSNKLQSTPPGEAQEMIKALQAQLEAMKPRRLTEMQKAAIAKTSIARGGGNYTLVVAKDMGASDSGAYADDLVRAFQNLQGWNITAAAVLGPSRTAACGLGLCVHNRTNLSTPERIVFDILQTAGVECEMIELVQPNAHVGLLVSTKS